MHLPNGCDWPQRVRINNNKAKVKTTSPTHTTQRMNLASQNANPSKLKQAGWLSQRDKAICRGSLIELCCKSSGGVRNERHGCRRAVLNNLLTGRMVFFRAGSVD